MTATPAIIQPAPSVPKNAQRQCSFLSLVRPIENETAGRIQSGRFIAEVSNATSTASKITENATEAIEWASSFDREGFLDRLRRIARSRDHDEVPIDPGAVVLGARLVDSAALRPELNNAWINPSVSRSPQGEIVLEWWHKENKLTLYISSRGVEYIRTWGPNIDTQMSDGRLNNSADLALHLRWLTTTP